MDLNIKLSNKKILVTGANGFIGANLCHRLQQTGAEVHALSRVEHKQDTVKSIKWWVMDLTDIEGVQALLATVKPNIILHLASHVTGDQGKKQVLPTFHNNLMSQVYLLVAASEIGCERIITVGSDKEPKMGEAQWHAFSPYVVAKWGASVYGQMFHLLYQLPIVHLRLHMTYGPGQKDIKKLIPHVTLSLLRGEMPKLSNGLLEADWIYVGDVVDGLIAAAQMPDVEGSILDLGTGELTNVRTIVELLAGKIDPHITPVFGTLPDRILEPVRVADVDEAFAKLGWRAKISLDDGLNKTVAWYRQQSDLLLLNP